MNSRLRLVPALLVAAALVGAGWGAATLAQQKKNEYGTPKTIIHVVTIQWKEGTPEAEKQKVFEGIKKMAAEIPGIQNVWLKATRVQPQEYHAAFAIEFADRAAADLYAEHPVHEEWSKHYQTIREASRSQQITND